MMEQSVRNQTTMSATTNRNRTAGGIEAPSIAASTSASASAATSASASAASASASAAPAASASTSSSSSSSVSSATCSATIVQAKQRPPPLKTATTTVTTTLVSSSEGGQPIPPTAHPGGGPGGSGAGAGAGGGTYRGATLTTPSTPRIELSRASSSSHHEEDSRESSPENVFEQVGTGTLQETIGLGFREDGALELRSSTEELYFMDAEQKKEEQERIQQQQQQAKRSSPHIFKFDDHQSYLQQHQRKDSASSEVAALLCISGRTSRISSVGSQGSAVSRLSAISGVSRSPSPHRMLLETSFCGPKPVELGAGTTGVVSGGGGGASGASTAASSAHSQSAAEGMPGAGTVAANAALLEQLLLARKHDPTQAVLAEGIKVLPPAPTAATSSRSRSRQTASSMANGERMAEKEPKTKPTIGAQRRSTKSPGQMVVGKTASGTEYIRINLRPDHMYSDKGIASNERVVEAPNQLAPVYSKPASLSLQGGPIEEHRLTPTASPKPGRRLTSRSPSPATGGGAGGGTVSRKSSFSSLFRLGKDSPDSPRETARSRSKSKERPATASGGLGGERGGGGGGGGGGGSQNVTPSKQKSVLAIFKPGKRGSQSSKSSSPIESSVEPVPPPPPPAPGSGSGSANRSRTPAGSRPGSRLRYYDEPVEGVIHIPLHTPPEEREARTLLQGIQQLTHAAQASMDPSPLPTHRAPPPASAQPVVASSTQITTTQLAAAAAALRPVAQRRVAQRPDLDAIQSLPSQEDPPGMGASGEEQALQPAEQANWSLEVQRHSSQDSQETTAESVGSVVSARAANLAQQREQAAAAAAMQRLPSVESTQSACEPRLVHTVATVNPAPNPDAEAAAKERRRLLFATRLGSGSQEQLFSTQFSISKTESQSSQLSEQVEHSGSETTTEGLQRQGTVIRRVEATSSSSTGPPPPPPRGVYSSEEEQGGSGGGGGAGAVVMRSKHKSRPSSEDEAAPATAAPADLRHSRYLENFDVRRKLHENLTEAELGRMAELPGGQVPIPRKPKRQSVAESRRETTSYSSGTATPTTPTPTAVGSVAPARQPPSSVTTPTNSGVPVTTPPAAAAAAQASTSFAASPGTTFYEPPSTSYRDPHGTGHREPPSTSFRDQVITCRHDPLTSSTPDPMAMTSPPSERRHSQSTDEHEPVESSESERDSDMAGSSSVTTAVPAGGEAGGRRHHNFPRNVCVIEEHESTGLVSQESFEDELPYIPTTLPEERAQGVPIIPMRERANMELKTCPVDRPRSTTPLNPSHLEEYCTGIMTPQEVTPGGGHQEIDGGGGAGGGGGGVTAGGGGVTTGTAGAGAPVRGEKLRISLPRKESLGKERIQNTKSPRRVSNTSGKTWFEFAEEGLRANNNLERKDSAKQLFPVVTPPAPAPAAPPPLAAPSHLEEPKPKASTQRKLSGHWIDFENIPEKRKPAKRITTLPKETLTSSVAATATTSSSSACGSGHHRSGTGAGTGHHHHHQHHQQPAKSHQDGGDKLHYNYVKPEDCQCECHEAERGESSTATAGGGDTSTETGTGTGTGTGSESLASVELLQQGEDMLPLLEPDTSAEGRIYGDEEQAPLVRHSGKGLSNPRVTQHDEFPRRDDGSSPRNRRFPDRK
ncbi:pneumococcal serine-rich repeat protein isoform X3 [Drosophila subpulchrella]|nr:pneumococcal serine-rich repeat protein isoform X3 [Drosophila subpulchrella]XP_037723566.1 pneumococcal serine-rich repeat protein isoform X3 [Drosophila subpulchrella]